MKFDSDAQVPLSQLIKRNVGSTIAIDILIVLLERAGLGLHPDRILISQNGHIEVQAGLPTPGYRAPDYQSGAPRPIHDVYVAGILLFELLAGQPLGQLPEREMLQSGALDRALNNLQAPTNIKQVLKAMMAFRPESRLDAKLAISELKRCRPEGQDLQDLSNILHTRTPSRSGATLIPGPSATLVPEAELPETPQAPEKPYQPLPIDPPIGEKKPNKMDSFWVVVGVIIILLFCAGFLPFVLVAIPVFLGILF